MNKNEKQKFGILIRLVGIVLIVATFLFLIWSVAMYWPCIHDDDMDSPRCQDDSSDVWIYIGFISGMTLTIFGSLIVGENKVKLPPPIVHTIDKIVVVEPEHYEVIELGQLIPGVIIRGALTQEENEEFYYFIVDRAGLTDYHQDKENPGAIDSGGKRTKYRVHLLIYETGYHYLILENYNKKYTSDIEVDLKITYPIEYGLENRISKE